MNNFHFLRLVFALLVVITHSYSLSGSSTRDYLTQITEGQVSFSFIGLSGFFIISGYLVFQSLTRSKNLLDYFKKRALRIFPALFVVLLLTVLLGYFVYEADFHSYLMEESVWTYLPRNLSLVKGQGIINGIFTHNPYNPTINGSLWSLLYEFSFYFALAALYFFKRPAQIWLVATTLIGLLVGRLFWYPELIGYNFILESRLVLEFAPFFFYGSLLALLKFENMNGKWRRLLAVLFISLLAFLIILKVFDQAKFFILPLLVILLALEPMPFINRAVDKLGDISYGVYIYAFPIQQTLMHFFKLTSLELMAASLILSCLFGYGSWHWIEKWALRYKN
jgi:peptidoglycan/LPS O-acetylase OafA/YrhL